MTCSPDAKTRIVIITGLSGSGKSTALKALEDNGFYAVDNLPVQLLPEFVDLFCTGEYNSKRAAIVMDLRAVGFADKFPAVFRNLGQRPGLELELVFLEAAFEALQPRFSQTRRNHPLTADAETLRDSITKELEVMRPVRNLASAVIDTSTYTSHDLRREIRDLYRDGNRAGEFRLNLMSFGFKHGLPPEADLVIDVRFLPNPYFEDKLRPLDGRDQEVVDYVFGREITADFVDRYLSLLDFLLPQYQREGKSQITLAIGCTGGQHRSVALTEHFAVLLATRGFKVTKRHRDISLEK